MQWLEVTVDASNGITLPAVGVVANDPSSEGTSAAPSPAAGSGRLVRHRSGVVAETRARRRRAAPLSARSQGAIDATEHNGLFSSADAIDLLPWPTLTDFSTPPARRPRRANYSGYLIT